jgi:hypothetical protein
VEKEKLEEKNRLQLKSTSNKVREKVVGDRKKELSRTLRDLDDMLQKLHATNQKRMREYQVLYSNENDLQKELGNLQKEIEELLKVDPESLPSDQMAGVSSKIEATRRNLLRIELTDESVGHIGGGSPFELPKFTGWQLSKIGFSLFLPLSLTVLIGFGLIAAAIVAIFG